MSAWERLQPKTPRGNRTLALSLFALAATLALGLIVVPAWLMHRYYADNAAMFARQLGSYTNLNQLRPVMVKSTETLKAMDTRKYFLKAATPALANAELQDVVKGVIESNGGRVLGVNPMAQTLKEDGGFKPTGIVVMVSANIQNLRKCLYALETREPYLLIDALTVRAQVGSNHKPLPGVEPEMFVQLDVIGYSSLAAGSEKGTDKGGDKPGKIDKTDKSTKPSAQPGNQAQRPGAGDKA